MTKIGKVTKYIIISIILLIIIYLLYLKNIRICLIYNLFKIPCPGCGLTTSTVCLIKGDVIDSLKYNIITIPLIVIYIICSLWYIIDIIKGTQTLKKLISKYKKYIVVISIVIFCVSFIKNITNPLLY